MWWFQEVPRQIDTANCLERNGLTLLYTGISPSQPPANGKRPSSQTLYDRVRNHYRGDAKGSTLRKTLGVLLAPELGTPLRRVGSGARQTFGRDLEKELISALDIPLNLQGNSHNTFYPALKRLRAEAALMAEALPIT